MLERGRLCVVSATIVINVVAVSVLTFAPWSDWRTGAALNVVDNLLLAFAPWSDWRTGAALNFVDNCLLVGFTVVRRDALQSVWL